MSAKPTEPASPGHERSDASVPAIFGFSFALALLVVVSLWVVRTLLDHFEASRAEARTPTHSLAEERQVPPAPRLQLDGARDLADLRMWEEQQLSTYAWVDREAGLVRIPLDVAMRRTLERGLPARGGASEAETEPAGRVR